MRSPRNSKPSVDGAPVVVSAPTLKEAYRIVRADYGEDAVILGTRTVNRRQELGLGHDREIEVTVQMPGATAAVSGLGSRTGRALSTGGTRAATATTGPDLNQEIIREVTRIEQLVAAIAEDHDRMSRQRLPYCDNPLAETLIENGASPAAVNTMLTRFTSETGNPVTDRPAAVAWLTENLRASNCSWDEFYGCHAFLGEAGCGRSDLVLTAAGLLQAMGRHTLVLSLMPTSSGDIKRLQLEASRVGFDAAVIKKESQLASAEKHLANYDVVLVDMPPLRHEVMAEGGRIHGWLARNTGFHRHLLVPMDKDPAYMDYLNRAVRVWNCDWVAISRADLSGRGGKLIDLLEKVPVPVSLTGANPAHGGSLEIAQSDRLLDAMLGGAEPDDFRPGVAAANETAVAEVAW